MRLPQPFFVGNEASTNPRVSSLVSVAHRFGEAGVGAGTISARHGLRATVNASGVTLSALGPAHFVEVADYDPHRETIMCLGSSPPSEHAGLHALVYRAKKEVEAIVQVDVPPAHAAHARLPRAKVERTVLETAMGVLERLRESDAISLGGHYVIAVGTTPEAAYERAMRELSVDGSANAG